MLHSGVAGTIVAAAWARRAPTRRELKRLAPAGILFGLSYVCLFEAYWRGRVTVVSPLVATESLWGVALSVLLIRHTEGMGRRLALGALLAWSQVHGLVNLWLDGPLSDSLPERGRSAAFLAMADAIVDASSHAIASL